MERTRKPLSSKSTAYLDLRQYSEIGIGRKSAELATLFSSAPLDPVSSKEGTSRERGSRLLPTYRVSSMSSAAICGSEKDNWERSAIVDRKFENLPKEEGPSVDI